MWKVHVKRKTLLWSTFLTRSFSWMPHWYSQPGKLLKKEGKENMVTSCVALRKSAVTLIHCYYNSIIYNLCGTQTAVNSVLSCMLSNQTALLLISTVKSEIFKLTEEEECGVHSNHRTGLYWEFHWAFQLHQLLICLAWKHRGSPETNGIMTTLFGSKLKYTVSNSMNKDTEEKRISSVVAATKALRIKLELSIQIICDGVLMFNS